MYRKSTVALPRFVSSDQGVKEWLEANPERWTEPLDLEVHQIEPRANLVDYEIDQIDVDGGEVFVQYTVEYNIYYGCKDIDGAGEDERNIVGKVVEGEVIFHTFVQPEPLAPDEEL